MPERPLEGESELNDFLAEELFVPNCDKVDGSRLNMFTNHVGQMVILKEPEIPLLFTRFENQIGKVSSTYMKAKEDFKVIAKIPRNERRYALIVEYKESKIIDVLNFETSRNITESYGYVMDAPPIDSWEEGEEVEKDAILASSTAYDEFNNLKYGVNLKTIYYTMEGMTFEDAICVSETAAKKLTHVTVTDFLIPVNSNDVMLNLYGDSSNYKVIPNIGEEIKDGILCSRRRMVNTILLSSMNDEALRKISANDSTYYGHGVIDDIFVYSNRDIEDITDPYMKQFKEILIKQEEYDRKLVETLDPFRNEGRLSSDASYAYTRSKDSINFGDSRKKSWISENNFDNMVIKIRAVYEKPCEIGSKISNRYGGKGVIGKIYKDEDMPMTEDGERVEVCLNPLGVLNRLNPAALYELELNAISHAIRKENKDADYDTKVKAIEYFYSMTNYEQHESFKNYLESLESDEERNKVVDEMFKDGFPLHMAPFFGNIDLDVLIDLLNESGIKPTKFVGIEQPITMGEMYFIKLKHEPTSKMSARSCGQINQKGIPNKANRNFKQGLSPYSNTPVRLGEQELMNLLLINDNKAVFDMLDYHSSNKEGRNILNNELLTKKLDEPVKVKESSYSTVKELLKAYLSTLGLKLEKS